MQAVILVLLGVIVFCVKLSVMLEFTLQMNSTRRSFMWSPSVMIFHKSGLLVGPRPKKEERKLNLLVNHKNKRNVIPSCLINLQLNIKKEQIQRFSKSFHQVFQVFLALYWGVINETAHTVAVKLNVVLFECKEGLKDLGLIFRFRWDRLISPSIVFGHHFVFSGQILFTS